MPYGFFFFIFICTRVGKCLKEFEWKGQVWYGIYLDIYFVVIAFLLRKAFYPTRLLLFMINKKYSFMTGVFIDWFIDVRLYLCNLTVFFTCMQSIFWPVIQTHFLWIFVRDIIVYEWYQSWVIKETYIGHYNLKSTCKLDLFDSKFLWTWFCSSASTV